MDKDYLDIIKELSKSNVHIKDKSRVNEIINELVKGGVKKLQVILDFDRTITKQHVNGVKQESSFGIFHKCPSLPESYVTSIESLRKKYMPIEFNPSIPIEEKKRHMEEWWELSKQVIIGKSASLKEIEEVVRDMKLALRDGCTDLFNHTTKENVPLLVFSAGLGQTVTAVLKYHNILNENVKVVANFFKYDENGVILGYENDVTINVFNKHESVLAGTSYYKTIQDRNNAIVVGDSLGDAGMYDGVENGNAVLKIGFLQEHVKENLGPYMETFDIVLVDDQTMDVPYAIFKCILNV